MNDKKLYIFIESNNWHCLLMQKNTRIKDTRFTSSPEEHLRSFLRGVSVKKAIVIISSESTILRFSKLPILNQPVLTKAASFLYEAHFPIDKDKYVFGYKIVSKSPDKYHLLLAALPSAVISKYIDMFNRLGIHLDLFGIFEGLGGLRLSEFNSILVFVKQKDSWRVIWMKNKTPIDIWRVTAPIDLHILFAGLEHGESIDHGLFYSAPEDWLIQYCEEYGLTISEALDYYDIFEGCADSISMLPAAYNNKGFARRLAGFTAILLTLLVFLVYSGSAWLKNRNENLTALNMELSGQIRSLNEMAVNQPTELPAELSANFSDYSYMLKVLTDRLPSGACLKHIATYEGTIRLVINSCGSEWLNQYKETCQSGLGISIQASKISQTDNTTEIELYIVLS